MKLYFYLILFLITPLFLFSQNISDAISLSIENENGNARYMSMGGAFGALGGNLSAISKNPASGAVFELSRFGGSLIANSNSTQAFYKSNVEKINSNNANYQAGLIYVFKNYGDGNLNKFSIGLNFQSQNNFNEEVKISGRSNNSIDKFFLNNSIGININNISVGSNESVRGVYKWLGDNIGYSAQQAFLGYQSYLLNYDSDNNSFYSLAKYDNGVDQENFIFSEGHNNMASFNISWQFRSNLYMGLNFNFHDILIEKELRHIESNFDSDSAITNIDFRNYLTTVGNGLSLQGGFIYKIGSIRLGLSYKTPTYYTLEDNLDQYMETSSIDIDGNTYTDIVDPRITNIYEYDFKSPSKLTISGAAVINNMILLSFDIISKNYAKTKFSHQFEDVYLDLNNALARNLNSVLDYNFGAELKLGELSLRGGYKILNSPYKVVNTNYFNSSSFGLGYNFNSSTIDLALVNSNTDYNYQLFDTGLTESASINDKKANIILSYNIIF